MHTWRHSRGAEPAAKADEVVDRIKKLDADLEVELDRALVARLERAIAKLERLEKRRPERKEIAVRTSRKCSRVRATRAPRRGGSKGVRQAAADARARFSVGRPRVREGAEEEGGVRGVALRHALAAALQVGADSDKLRSAVDLLEGATDLGAYRKDGLAVDRDFESWEKSGHHIEGPPSPGARLRRALGTRR